MNYITQLIYIIPGQEAVFEQFEQVAIPIIAKYNGKLLFSGSPGCVKSILNSSMFIFVYVVF